MLQVSMPVITSTQKMLWRAALRMQMGQLIVDLSQLP
jgi:hypothetical protein